MKRIALINDLSGFGKCSLAAAIPVISAMGVQACPLPTAVLSAQTGFDSFYYDDYTEQMSRITDEWAKMGVDFDGIASGYLGNHEQIENVISFLEKFKSEKTLYLADPVMGDNGRCIKIFSGQLLNTMRELTKRADIITPNITELCLLAGIEYQSLVDFQNSEDYLERITEVVGEVLSRARGKQTVIVTGIIREKDQEKHMGNLIVDTAGISYHESPYTGMSFSGTGDLFASVVIGAMVQGKSAGEAVRLAVDFLQPAIEEATIENIPRNHGVHFEKYLSKLMA